MMRVERYNDSKKQAWDEFIAKSKNGTFLFLRDYMDYHRDRISDYSLLVWDDNDTLAAVLPAHFNGTVLSSHGGLTYGGFVSDNNMKLPRMLQVFEAGLGFLQLNSFTRLIYKVVPHIYHRVPAEEDSYALFLCNARLTRRGVLTVIDSQHPLPVQERRRRGAKKAKQNGLVVRQNNDFESYWKILSERLLEAFGTRPAHSLPEMQSLHSKFPDNIKLFSAYQDNSMLAGVLTYESDQVARAQYIAANKQSRELGALDLIISELLGNYYREKRYFDLGTSDTAEGRMLTKGLIDQKEGYGARVVGHDHYDLDLANWVPGRLIGALR